MRSRNFAGSAASVAIGLSFASVAAEASARAQGASLWAILGWPAAGLAGKLALPAACLGVCVGIAAPVFMLLALALVLLRLRSDLVARRALPPAAPPPPDAPYALPARVAVALAAAARARR